MRNSRRHAALSFVPIIVIALAFASYLALSSGTSLIGPASDSIGSSSSCSNPYIRYDSSNPIVALAINPGQTGKICVKYSNIFNNSESDPAYISVYQFNPSRVYGVCADCNSNLVTFEFQVSANPSTVNLSSFGMSSTSETVTYSIGVPLNVTSGIYGIFLFQFCSLFPVVVEPAIGSTMQLNVSDFSAVLHDVEWRTISAKYDV